MVEVSMEYTPLKDTFNQYNERIGNNNLFLVAYTRNTRRLITRWKAALKVEPTAAGNYYPLHWKSRKQQIKVILLLKAQGNLPYPRTHELTNAWTGFVESFENGGSLVMENRSPHAGFVYGDFDNPRQPMFDGSTGGVPWLDPFSVSAPYFDQAEQVLVQTFHTILSPTAGVFD